MYPYIYFSTFLLTLYFQLSIVYSGFDQLRPEKKRKYVTRYIAIRLGLI